MTRLIFGSALFIGVALMIVIGADSSCSFAVAADKNSKEEMILQQQLKQAKVAIDQLENQLQRMKQEVNERDAKIRTLQMAGKIEEKQDQTVIQNLRKELEAAKKQLNAGKKDADADTFRSSHFVRVVFYKMKPDAPKGEAQTVIEDARKMLGKIDGLNGIWVGGLDESAPDSSKNIANLGIVLMFDDAAAFKKFLADPAYKKFADKHKQYADGNSFYDFKK